MDTAALLHRNRQKADQLWQQVLRQLVFLARTVMFRLQDSSAPRRLRSDSFSSGLTASLRGSTATGLADPAPAPTFSHGTLPRGGGGSPWAAWPSPPQHRLSISQHNLTDVERMYRAMRDLNTPLPGRAGEEGGVGAVQREGVPVLRPGESLESVLTTQAEMPPAPPPVQSHAVLEVGLGRPVAPRTPGPSRRPAQCPTFPPRPPQRCGTNPTRPRPANLNLPHGQQTIYSNRPKPFQVNTSLSLVAKVHSLLGSLQDRSSLMSTGSSDSGSSSSGPASSGDQDPLLSPLSPGSEIQQFSWPGTETTSLASSQPSLANTSMTEHSGVYVKMQPASSLFTVEAGPDCDYMNLLYSAVQGQGGSGSVETAMSPYLAMAASPARPGTVTPAESAIYAQIDSTVGSCERLSRVGGAGAGRRAQFKQLMLEVEQKRHFRVGLNLFNTVPDVGVDYLVKLNFIELSPLSVAKFLYKNQGLAKAKIGEYLGQTKSAFSMKVLDLLMQEFDLAGLRLDKALRKLCTCFTIPDKAEKAERILEVFSKRWVKCNPSSKLEGVEAVSSLAAAILNTARQLLDNKQGKERAGLEAELVRHKQRGLEGRQLRQVYKGLRKKGLAGEGDHVKDIELLQSSLTGQAPSLSAHHRRLVCICTLNLVKNIKSQQESEASAHPRTVWLFNDLVVVTKDAGRGTSQYRDSFPLAGLEVSLFHTAVFQFGIQLFRKRDRTVLATLSVQSEQDRYKFVMDLQESIFEVDLMHRAARQANMIK